MSNEYINNQNHGCCGEEKVGKTSSCKCDAGIRKSLVAIFECFKMYSYYATDSISIEITLINGLKYPITVSMADLRSVCIRSKVANFGDLAISICDIAKVKVLADDPINQNLMKCINAKLCAIANNSHGGCSCNSAYDYLAVSYEGPNNCRGNRPPCQPSPCPPPPPCPMPPPPPRGEGCCVDEMQKAIAYNKDEVDSLGFNGAVESVGIVSSVTSVEYAKVLNSAAVTLSATTVIASVSVVPSLVPVVNTIVQGKSSVVQIVNFKSTTLVANIVPVTTTALQSIAVSPVTVVTGLNFLTPITVVTNVASTTTPVVTAVNQTPITVVKGVSIGKIKAIGGESITPTTVITSITPTTTSAITGITSATAIIPITATIPFIAVTGPFPAILTVTVAGVSTPVLVNGKPVTIVSVTPSKVLSITAQTVLGVAGTPAVSTVIATAPSQSTAISNISVATLVSVVNTVTITPVTVLASVTAPTIVGVATVTPTTGAIIIVDPFVPETTTVVSRITAQTIVSVLKDAKPIFEDVNEVTQVTNVTITQIASIGLTTVVKGGRLILGSSRVLNNVRLITTAVTVMENIGLEDVSVITPVTVPINGEILCIGNGILVVQETTGDISIYSTCEINSFSVV